MTATGRGAASVPITVSPDNASPAPAGHKCGRRTNACSPSVTSEIARTDADQGALGRQAHAASNCSACDILHKRPEIRRSVT